MMSEQSPRYGLIVPVKPPAVAKSRLGELGDHVRRELAAAFAADTVDAARRCDRVVSVLVVTDDHLLAADFAKAGVDVLPDGAGLDLNAALVQAAAEMLRRYPDLRIAALCADLPALRPEDLSHVLVAAPGDRMGFVADADRIGTTLVTAPDLDTFRPRFGPGSRDLHLDAGALEIELDDVVSMRRDVDTPADLIQALRYGVGARSARVTTDLF